MTASNDTTTTSRRGMLSLAGLSIASGATFALAPTSATAVPQGTADTEFTRIATVADLADLEPRDGDVVVVTGYHEPTDGGGMLLRWMAGSTSSVNGGTVHAGAASAGRWHQLHDGVGDFRRFGIFGADQDADDALAAMVEDPSFHTIQARTPLNFIRRHTFTRSNLTLDFGGNLVTAEGIEPNAQTIKEYGAVFGFAGVRTDQTHTVTLSETMPELSDVYEVNDSTWFSQDAWYEVISDLPPGGFSYSADQELQRLVQVTEIVDARHIRVNYKNGWELAAGRKTNWTRVEPVQRIRIENLDFRGPGGDNVSGAHPISFLYAVNCDVDRVHASRSYWSLCMRGYNTYFETTRCTLNDPVDAAAGGAGYLTQQMYCLYGRVADCHTSRARHLVDFTASAYSVVENCHGDGDFMGPFVTHGQYEHDLTYTGNSGMMTFANSGNKWGSWIKRVTVRKHVGPLFFSGRRGPSIEVKAVDLTLEDVEIIQDPDMFAQPSGYQAWGWVNADGLQMRGCRVDDSFHIYQNSSVSKRPTVFEGCTFSQEQYYVGLPFIDATVTSPLQFTRCVIDNLDGETMPVNSGAPLDFSSCLISGKAGGTTMTLPSSRITLRDCTVEDVGLALAGNAEQSITISGDTRFSGASPSGAYLRRAAADGTLTWNLNGYNGAAGEGISHIELTMGVNHYRAVGAAFHGGSLVVTEEAVASGSMLHSACVEVSVNRRDFPETGGAILIEGNLEL